MHLCLDWQIDIKIYSYLLLWRTHLKSSPVQSMYHHLATEQLCQLESVSAYLHAGSQCEELCPWQRSWGRSLGIRKGRIKPQETPCSWASIPKPESTYFTVSCSHLHLGLYGGLFPTGSLGEGVNLQLQSIKIPGCDKGGSGQTSLLAD